MMNRNLKKKKEETFEAYCHRLALMREDIGTWDDLAKIINKNTGCNYGADKYRKQEARYQEMLAGVNADTEEAEDNEDYEEEYTTFNKESITVNYEKNETTSTKEIPLTEEELKSPSALLKAHGFNPLEFEIKTANNTKTTRKTINGDTYVYSSRILVKPKNSVVTDVEQIAEYFKTYKSPKLNIPKNTKKSNETLLIPLYDLHFGRIEDVEDYKGFNVEEEKNRIVEHVKKYIAKFKGRTFKDIYLVVGQDFLNSSFTGFTSSQSHLQDNAIDFRTMFKNGSELLIDIINMFAEVGNKVNVIGSLGNHCTAEEFALFSLLQAYYRTVSNVNVDNNPAPRKYYNLGAATVGVGHADKEGKRIFGLMQVEAKDIWAKTKQHIFIAGHLHHFKVESENGVELYRVPSICAHDRWTVEQGYVMNEPKTMCFIFDDEEGLIETHFMYL